MSRETEEEREGKGGREGGRDVPVRMPWMRAKPVTINVPFTTGGGGREGGREGRSPNKTPKCLPTGQNAVDARKARDDRSTIQRFELLETRAVHYPANDATDVKALLGVSGDEAT